MESVCRSLDSVLVAMAQGSQRKAVTILNVVASGRTVLGCGVSVLRDAQQLAALQPRVRDLLHAAGWLAGCLTQTGLDEDCKEVARLTCTGYVHLAANVLITARPTSGVALQQLVEPCRRPQVPGVLDWLDSLAAEVAPSLDADALRLYNMAGHILWLWLALARNWAKGGGHSHVSPLLMMRPGVLRLLQHLALHPPPPVLSLLPAPARLGLQPTCIGHGLEAATALCGDVMARCWGLQPLQMGPSQQTHAGSSANTNHSASSSSSSSNNTGPSAELTSMIMESEEFWWGGVAAVASSARLRAVSPTPTGAAAATTTSSSSGGGGNTAARICPSYHKGQPWPVLGGLTPSESSYSYGQHCLGVLLIREVLGSQPWALQQLKPHKTAQKAGSSIAAAASAAGEDVLLLGIQWPLLLGYRENTSSSSSSSSSSRSSSSSSRAACQCRSPVCHLCTPPPPVTLQQLRSVLEVVCLTCMETTMQGQQALLLLALLLQRASPGVRAGFLNSEDGVRLLVALQQAPDPTDAEMAGFTGNSTWSFINHAGAVSTMAAAIQSGQHAKATFAVYRAVLGLAWCFLEPAPGSTTAAAAAAAAAAATNRAPPTGRPGVGLATPAAVANGSVLRFHDYWEANVHMLGVPSTFLRLAAGVVPSLALFATLEQLLRRCHRDQFPELLTTLLAAVQAVLAPMGDGHCGCSQQVPPGGLANDAHPTTTDSSSGSNGPDSTPTPSSNSSAPTPSNVAGNLPGVLAAVSSATFTVSKALFMQCGDVLIAADVNLLKLSNALLLAAALGDSVLQLALQQLQHHHQQQQQPQPQPGMSRVEIGVVQAAQRLLDRTVFGIMTVVGRQAARYDVMAGGASRSESAPQPLSAATPAGAAASSSFNVQQHQQFRRLALVQLRTTQARVTAWRHAAPQAWLPATQQQAPAAAAAHAAAEATGGTSSGGHTTPPPVPDSGACWCPAHSSGHAPAALCSTDYMQVEPFKDMWKSYAFHPSRPLWVSSCNYRDCSNLSGPSDAGLVTGCSGGVCSRCGVAHFCSPDCAHKAWPAHSKVCGRLAAALGRPCSSGSSSTSGSHRRTATTDTSSSRSSQPPSPGSGTGRGPGASLAAAAAAVGPVSSSSSSSRDAAPVRGQAPGVPPLAAGQVCAWCGASSRQLLRCGRCKAAWYCGVDHQRAAWKAGHKQECGAFAGAVSKVQG